MNENMQKIKVLSQDTVDKIRAGEVVERPASVIKELVENSLDADSHRIRIEVYLKDKELYKLHVTDDGLGMSYDDVKIAPLPHTTSKIASIEDLNALSTLGFRGEALSSIAAVSTLIITTKARYSESIGSKIIVKDGEFISFNEVASSDGTFIEVTDLFSTTPARKKFQKSFRTELSLIQTLLTSFALAHPDVGFTLKRDGKPILEVPPTGNLIDTISVLFGSEIVKDLKPLLIERSGFEIKGYLSKPGLSRNGPYHIYISVNNRTVYSKSLIKAITDGYGTLLMTHRFPVGFLSITIPGKCIDVNIHPTKRTIRFQDESVIVSSIRSAVDELFTEGNEPLSYTIPLPEKEKIRYRVETPLTLAVHEPSLSKLRQTGEKLRQTSLSLKKEENQIQNLKIIGQFCEEYIICESGEGELIIFDQHAAHERILYEYIKQSGKNMRQELISPVSLQLSPGDATRLESVFEDLENYGFNIEKFGKDSFVVRSIPDVLGRSTDSDSVRNIIEDIIHSQETEALPFREKIQRLISCRGAIKSGLPFSPANSERLIEQLGQCKNRFTCPHGRPIMISYPLDLIRKAFKRI